MSQQRGRTSVEVADDAMQGYYHKVHQPATRVLDCAVGNFLGDGTPCVITTHGSQLMLFGPLPAEPANQPKRPAVSRHVDPLGDPIAMESAAEPTPFEALQVFPINGVALFTRTISALAGPASGDSRKPKDFLFVYTERRQFLLLQFHLSKRAATGFELPQPSSEFPAESAPFIDVETIVAGQLPVERATASMTTELCASSAESKLVALHLSPRRIVYINFTQSINRYWTHVNEGGAWGPEQRSASKEIIMNELIENRLDVDFYRAIALKDDTLYVLHDERRNRMRRHLSKVKAAQPTDFATSQLVQQDVDNTASALIGMHNGVCVLGENFVSFINGVEQPKTIKLPAGVLSPPTAVVSIDHWRFLVGYAQGSLCIVSVLPPPSAVNSAPPPPAIMSRSPLPLDIHLVTSEISSPSALAYIDGGYCFCGSSYGDSVVVNLLHGGKDVLLPNLGPVLCVTPIRTKSGCSSIVVGCGGQKDGSIAVLKVGADVEVVAELPDVGAVKALFNVADRLLLSYPTASKLLSFAGEELRETENPGALDVGSSTLFAGAVDNNFFVQVSRRKLVIAPIESLDGGGRQVGGSSSSTVVIDFPLEPTHADFNYSCKVLAVAVGKEVQLRQLVSGKTCEIRVNHSLPLPGEVACLRVTDDGEVVLGIWGTNDIILLSNPLDRSSVPVRLTTAPALPRSVILHRLNPIANRALVVGLSDGTIAFTTEIDSKGRGSDEGARVRTEEEEAEGEESEQKKQGVAPCLTVVELGSQPVHLTLLTSGTGSATSEASIIALGDSPALLHMPRRDIRMMALSSPNSATALVEFGGEGQVCYVSEQSLFIGCMSQQNKLSKRRLVESGPVEFVAFHSSTDHVVCCVHGQTKDEIALYKVPQLEQQGRIALADQERATAVISAILGVEAENTGANAPQPFEAVVVAITFCLNEEREPQFSRLQVYIVTERGKTDPQAASAALPPSASASSKDSVSNSSAGSLCCLTPIGHQREVQGGVYSACSANNGKILVGTQGQVDVFGWSFSDTSLVSESFVKLGLIPVSLRAYGENLFVVGDIRNSISLLQFTDEEHIAVVAKDIQCHSVMDAVVCGTDAFFCDDEGNVVSLWHPVLAQLKKTLAGNPDDEATTQKSTPRKSSVAHGIRSRARSTAAQVMQLVRAPMKAASGWHHGDTIDSLALGSFSGLDLYAFRKGRSDTMSGPGKSVTTPSTVTQNLFTPGRLPILYGTKNGGLGSFLPIQRPICFFLHYVSYAMQQVVIPVGGLSPLHARAIMSSPKHLFLSKGIVDGGVVEQFLELPTRTQKEKVIAAILASFDQEVNPPTKPAATQEVSASDAPVQKPTEAASPTRKSTSSTGEGVLSLTDEVIGILAVYATQEFPSTEGLSLSQVLTVDCLEGLLWDMQRFS